MQGIRVAQQGDGEVWSKPLADGSRALVLLNRSSDPLAITTTAAAAGLAPAASYSLRDLWTGARSVTAGVVQESVPGHGAVMLRVARG